VDLENDELAWFPGFRDQWGLDPDAEDFLRELLFA
jgi:hypothetical protein